MLPGVHSMCNFHDFFGLHFCLSGQLGSSGTLVFSSTLIHAKFTIVLPLVLPSSLPPHDSLSLHHHLHIQGGHLHSICQLSQLFVSLVLLNSNEKVVPWEASSVLAWDHHTIQIVANPTEGLDTALVYLSLANPVLKPEVCKNPKSSQL